MTALPLILLALVALVCAAARWTERLRARKTEADCEAARLEHAKANVLLEGSRRDIERLDTALAAKAAEIRDLSTRNTELLSANTELRANLNHEMNKSTEKLALLENARTELANSFEALAAAALNQNNEAFLQLAKSELNTHKALAAGELEIRKQAVENIVAPISTALTHIDQQIRAIELERKGAYEGLLQQVAFLANGQQQLQSETANLVKALRAPSVRGRWGEIQLQRVVELAGMLEHCDFVQQETTTSDQGRLRPDLIVRLPGAKNVVVDAKAPLQAYLEALETSDEDSRVRSLKAHARQIRDHIAKLSAKSYWDQFAPAPEFVIMFLPGETFFSAALQQDPGLLEEGVNQGVIVASPTTLIALLRAVAYGWRQEKVADNARHISELGKELYDRLRIFSEHVLGMGRNLDRAVECYNKAVGSLETRVLVSARKFAELGAVAEETLPAAEVIERRPRTLQLAASAGVGSVSVPQLD